MKPTGLAIALAVADLDEAVETYKRLLGVDDAERASSPEDGVDVATFRIGDGLLQLVAPTNDTSPIARHLTEHGPGLHHLGLVVESMDATVEHVTAIEARTLGEPRPGAQGPVLFLHPKTAHGALIELLELKEA